MENVIESLKEAVSQKKIDLYSLHHLELQRVYEDVVIRVSSYEEEKGLGRIESEFRQLIQQHKRSRTAKQKRFVWIATISVKIDLRRLLWNYFDLNYELIVRNGKTTYIGWCDRFSTLCERDALTPELF